MHVKESFRSTCHGNGHKPGNERRTCAQVSLSSRISNKNSKEQAVNHLHEFASDLFPNWRHSQDKFEWENDKFKAISKGVTCFKKQKIWIGRFSLCSCSRNTIMLPKVLALSRCNSDFMPWQSQQFRTASKYWMKTRKAQHFISALQLSPTTQPYSCYSEVARRMSTLIIR